MAAATIVLIVCFLSLETQILAANIKKETGLYDPKDLVVVLDNSTLDDTIYNCSKAWFVEFYSSYCGHCINFAPTYTEFAKDVRDWKSIVDVAAIDCSRSENMVTCRDHEVDAFPTMKIFNPYSRHVNTSRMTYKGGRSLANLRHGMIDAVEKYVPDKRNEKTWPNLKPVNVSWIVEYFTRHNPRNVKYLAIVFEDSTSYLGREFILDMTPHRNDVVVCRTLMADNPLIDKWLIEKFPSLFVIESDISPKALSLSGTREIFNQRLLQFLGDKPQNKPSKGDKIAKDNTKVTGGNPHIAAGLKVPKADIKADTIQVTRGNPHIVAGLKVPKADIIKDTIQVTGGNPHIVAGLQAPKADIIKDINQDLNKMPQIMIPKDNMVQPQIMIPQDNMAQINQAGVKTDGAQIPAVNVADEIKLEYNYIKDKEQVQRGNQHGDRHEESHDFEAGDDNIAGMAAPDDFNAGPIADQDHRKKEESVNESKTLPSHQDLWDKVHERGREKAESMVVMAEEQTLQKPPIHMLDLESTLHYALRHEIPLHAIFKDDALVALKNFVSVLARYFPGRPQVMNYLEGIRFWLSDSKKAEILSDDWLVFVNRQYDPEMPEDAYLPKQISWVGCEGSLPKYRGYPCGLWTLFHTLAVSHVSTNRMIEDPNVLEVLAAMKSFIKYFFSCRECSQNFAKESLNMEQEVKTLDESILWLWKTHNRVNKRLHGDNTEDPKHQKVQFPPNNLCPSCRQGDDDSWQEKNVLIFLKDFYGLKNINFDNLESDESSHRVTNKGESAEEVKRRVRERFRQKEVELRLQRVEGKLGGGYFGLGVNSLDLSMCFVLYVLCATLVTFIYMMIWRRRRRKLSKYQV